MANQNGRGWTWLVVLALLAGGGYAGWRWYAKRPASDTPNLKTAPVARGEVTQSVTANGSLTPVRMVEVGSQISGTITNITVDFNTKVKEGQLLAQIDSATYERALLQAEADLDNAKASARLAELNFNRAKELFGSKLISQSEYDQTDAAVLQSRAIVKMREASLERAKVDLSRTTIYAPMDGMVISRRVEAGQTVAASMNTPTLFLIANDLAKMQIEAAVSEADVGGLEEGQNVQFTVDAFPGRSFQGKVQQVRFAPTTNQNVVTYTTVVAVDNRDLKLRPGMTANAKFITAERKNVLKIPLAAVRFRPPTGYAVKGDTNAPAGTNAPTTTAALIESGPFAGLPVMPWMSTGERRRPTDEERAAYAAKLTPEQKEKYEKAMAEIRARFAQGGGPGGGGGGGFGGGGPGGGGGGGGFGFGGGERRSSQTEAPKSGQVYLVESDPTAAVGALPTLKVATVKLGISDGTSVEVLEGIQEGDVVASGTAAATGTAGATNAPRNPFSPFGGPGRPR